MNSTALYAATAVVLAILTAAVFATLGGGSYIFILYGAILAVVFAGFAYDEHRAAAERAAARAR